METKMEKKTFGFAEFNEEEKWLEDQHKAGWRFVKTNGSKFYFEKCDASEWIYQLDFKENGVKEDSYVQLFTDSGWEFVFQFRRWFYFRKRKTDEDIDLSIFSDNSSKIDMCQRIIKRLPAFVVPIFVVSSLTYYLSMFTTVFQVDGFVTAALPWVSGGMMIATSFAFGQYVKLYKMIEGLKNPIK